MILLLLIWQLVSNSSRTRRSHSGGDGFLRKESFYPYLSEKLIGAGTNVCFTGEMILEHQNNLVVGFNPFEKISQIGSFPQVEMKIKNIWNHQLVIVSPKKSNMFG